MAQGRCISEALCCSSLVQSTAPTPHDMNVTHHHTKTMSLTEATDTCSTATQHEASLDTGGPCHQGTVPSRRGLRVLSQAVPREDTVPTR